MGLSGRRRAKLKAGRLPLAVSALTWLLLFAVVAVITLTSLPSHGLFWARMMPWLLARSSALAALLVLTAAVMLGILLSHPQNLSEWKFSKIMIVWHRYLTVLAVGLIVLHVGAIVLDSYARVGFFGALVPGLSPYRTIPVALGTVALYGIALLAVTAGNPRLLGGARWLKIHRLGVVVFALVWVHGVLTGTDTLSLRLLYILSGLSVLTAYAGRWWVDRRLPQRGEAATPTNR